MFDGWLMDVIAGCWFPEIWYNFIGFDPSSYPIHKELAYVVMNFMKKTRGIPWWFSAMEKGFSVTKDKIFALW